MVSFIFPFGALLVVSRVTATTIPEYATAAPDECDCEWHFFQHYTVKKCEPVYENGACCPVRFDCPERIERDETVCHFKGKTYQMGEMIEHPSLCEPCMCIEFIGKPEITCPADGCGWIRDHRLDDPRCYEVYENGGCCSSGIKCDTDDSSNNKADEICIFEGKEYRYGQKIYPSGNRCVTCYCNKNWTGLHGSTCYPDDCLLEIKMNNLEEGCIPVYVEGICCPVEYYCRTGRQEVTLRSKSTAIVGKSDDEKYKCKFNGKSYNIGDNIDIKDRYDCISCTCRIPPDFTCMSRRCPSRPDRVYHNWRPKYDPGNICLYNGTLYDDGDEVPTRGSCLRCVCKKKLRKGFAKPSMDQCAVIDCRDEWKGDCTPVYEEGQCCPVSWNCSISSGVVPLVVPNKYDCDWHFFQHYSVKKCEPVYKNGSGCPIRFDCPEKIERDETVCHYKEKTYHVGEVIEEPGLCRSCTCIQVEGKPEINCTTVECGLQTNDPKLYRIGCYEVYEEGACCSSEVKCGYDRLFGKPGKDCVFEGKLYRHGQKMKSIWKPCVTCYCNENFTGIHGSTCYTFDCNLEIKMKYLEEGCIPVYDEENCCPIQYHCKTGEEEVVPRSRPAALDADNDNEENKCMFDGNSYNIGDILDIKDHTNCISCTCRTPPDFTCIHMRCPPPPNNDHVNCSAKYVPGKCCPTYECVQEKPTSCDPADCPGSFMTVMYPNGCPICMGWNKLCELPKCPLGCTLEVDYRYDSCPTCKCPDNVPEKPSCNHVQCGPQCHRAIRSNGCPMCICSALCPLQDSSAGCRMEAFVLKGQCPRCIIEETGELAQKSAQGPQIHCSPVLCAGSCREVKGPNGCQMCDCGLICPTPKCDPGCRIETVPSSGPCPGCMCDSLPQVIQCAPVKCTRNCREVRIPNGCPMCMCDNVLCSPPKCPSGCRVNYDVPSRSCPDCKCPSTIPLVRPVCVPVKCGPQCREAISSQGCPMCVCGPLCSPPKCEPGCQVQEQVPEGQCPGCYCSGSDVKPRSVSGIQIQCGSVECPDMWKVAIGENGCPACAFEPDCLPPRCDHGCSLQYTSPNSPCPECVCDPVPSVPPQVSCSLLKCDEPDCRIDNTTQPCPSCVCDVGPAHPIQCSAPVCNQPGCRIDFTAYPCPECVCDVPEVSCITPKCDEPGCRINYQTKPCPECICNSDYVPFFACSMPQCGPDCEVDYDAEPCPACKCHSQSGPRVACPPPQCGPSCQLDYSTKPCPSCYCGKEGYSWWFE